MFETPPTILIVEGDDDTRHTLRTLLADQGWQTLEAASAAQARGHLRRSNTPVNAVLLDLGRPGSREAQELRGLVNEGTPCRQPAVILTGTSPHERLAPPLSGLPLILKPYVFEELLRTLEREVHKVHGRRIEAGGQGDARSGEGA
jgi:DNA-binding NtrC family response regulator